MTPIIKRMLGLLMGLALTVGITGCGSSSDDDCQLVCDKSAECGSQAGNCLESCKADPPSQACLACYREESCSAVGSCLRSCNE